MRCLASLGSLILLRGLRGSNVNKEHTGHMKEFSGFAVALPQTSTVEELNSKATVLL